MELADLEYVYLAEELNGLIENGRVEKIYQISADTFTIKISCEGKKYMLLVKLPQYMTITSRKIDTPQTPSNFSMLLRKKISNARIVSVKQKDFERIITFEINARGEKLSLIFEMFSKGNIILCRNNVIEALYRRESWKDRVVKKGAEYVPPPSKKSPLNATEDDICMNSKKTLMAGVLSKISLSPKYLEEAFARAGIDAKRSTELSGAEKHALLQSIAEVCKERRFVMYLKDGTPIDYSVCSLSKYDECEQKQFESVIQMIDEFYTPFENEKAKIPEKNKSKVAVEHMKKRLAELHKDAKLYKMKGDYIYEHYAEIEEIMSEVKSLKKNGMNDEQINIVLAKKYPGKYVFKKNILKIVVKKNGLDE